MRPIKDIVEAEVQMELYRLCVNAGFSVYPEFVTNFGRLDLVIGDSGSNTVFAIVECKRPYKDGFGAADANHYHQTNQIKRYKRIGLPVFVLTNPNHAKLLIDRKLAPLLSDKTAVRFTTEELRGMKNEMKRQRRNKRAARKHIELVRWDD